jgi:hypothetical protein
VGCIKATSGKKADSDDKLKNVGIPDSDYIDLLRNLIVVSDAHGVGHYDHRLDPNELIDMKPGWTVSKVAGIVEDKSTPIQTEE